MAEVFISYARADEADAGMLSALLEAHGYTVWMDLSLRGGEAFSERIAAEIDKARAVVAIWTKSSVGSIWVQAEAARALRDQKLVPVRSPDLEPTDIPLPFDSVNTLKLNQTEKLLEAVAAKLVKPASAGPWWKVFRYNLLSWLGMIGGAITLASNIGGIFKLSAAFSWVLANWSALLKYLWQALLFFRVEVSPYDAQFLTIGLLMGSAIVYSSRQPDSAVQKSPATTRQESSSDQLFAAVPWFLALCWSLTIILAVLAIGAVDIGSSEMEKDRKTWQSAAARLFVGRQDCLNALDSLERLQLRARQDSDERELLDKELKDCFKLVSMTGLNEKERSLVQKYPPPIGFGNGSLWVDFVFSAPSHVLFWVFGIVAVLSPVFLPFALYRLAKSMYPLKLRVPVLADRLWRTLILLSTILILNLIVLNAEGWLKAIPHQL